MDPAAEKVNVKYEIELEIVDLDYLGQFVHGQRLLEVASLVKRFLRNI